MIPPAGRVSSTPPNGLTFWSWKSTPSSRTPPPEPLRRRSSANSPPSKLPRKVTPHPGIAGVGPISRSLGPLFPRSPLPRQAPSRVFPSQPTESARKKLSPSLPIISPLRRIIVSCLNQTIPRRRLSAFTIRNHLEKSPPGLGGIELTSIV
jgi:hypothetical protein